MLSISVHSKSSGHIASPTVDSMASFEAACVLWRRSWLDCFIVGMSLLSVTNEPTGFVRVLRSLRVIRLFGRFHALRKIITAITLAIIPVLNVFLILFLLISIGKKTSAIGEAICFMIFSILVPH